ncbi:MAG: DUF3987 domain-containing protein [Burkholderiales bacterium]|nr:DUF3987 domain-containing protein [Burkholderiales bacterium]
MIFSEYIVFRDPDMSLLGTGRSKPPPFPTQVLGPSWSNWAQMQAASRCCPVDFVVASLLASAATLIGNARRAAPHANWQEPTHLWIAVVGDPSSGKTQGLKPSLDIVHGIDASLQAERKLRLAAYKPIKERASVIKAAWREEAKKARKDGLAMPDIPADAEPPPFQDVARLVITDATIEKVARIAASSPKGILQERDELSGWFESFNRYSGGSDRPFWLQAYNGGRYGVDRMSEADPVVVERLAVGIVGGLQPDRLEHVTRDGDDGLPCRFLYFWPDPTLDFRAAGLPDLGEGAIAAFHRLHELDLIPSNAGPIPKLLALDPSALARFESFGQQMRDQAYGASGPLAGVYGKAAGTVLRLSTVLTYLIWCAADGEPEPRVITSDVLANAIELMESYLLPQARRVFREASIPVHEQHAKMLAIEIRKRKLAKFSARDLGRAVGGPLRKAKNMEAALEELMDWNYIRSIKTGTRRKEFEVNPKLLEGPPS